MCNILVVDDNEGLLDLFEIILKSKGYKVRTANDGLRAIELVEEHIKTGVDIDLILLDYRMYGYDGIETAKYIHKLDSSINIIFISADDSIEQKVLAMERVQGFLKKPFKMQTILELVDQTLMSHKS